jgi:hypothetical protein
MKKAIYIFLLFYLVNVNLFSQNWVNGFITTLKGDTIWGKIENKESNSFSRKCKFKKDEKSNTDIFYPKDISSFGVTNGQLFISKAIPTDDSTKTVFLEFMVRGKINLYHYKDVDNADYYYIEKEAVLYELKNTLEESSLSENKEYIRMLNQLMYGAQMEDRINQSGYNYDELMSITEEYHKTVCPNEKCIVYKKKVIPTIISHSIHVGISDNQFKLGAYAYSSHENPIFLGYKIEVKNILEWNTSISLVADLNLKYYPAYKFNVTPNNRLYDYTYFICNNKKYHSCNANLNIAAIEIPISFNYTFLKGNIKPYLGAGVYNGFFLIKNEDLKYYLFDYNNVNIIPLYQLGYIARLGTSFTFKNNKSTYIELNYTSSKSMERIEKSLCLLNYMFSIELGYGF